MIASPRLIAMVLGGLIFVALLVALFATRAALSEAKGRNEAMSAKLAVSNASVEACAVELEKALGAMRALATDDANRISASRQQIELARAAESARQAAIERLRQSAAAMVDLPDAPSCDASQALLEDWPA